MSDSTGSVAQRINELITSRRPDWICDKCIMNTLGLSQHAHVAQNTIALATTSDFKRKMGQMYRLQERQAHNSSDVD